MKGRIFAACALTMALLALAGCSNTMPAASREAPASNSQMTADESASGSAAKSDAAADKSATSSAPAASTGADASTPTGKTVSPLPTGIDMAHLDDCTVAVSFDKGDAYVDDTGAMQLKVKVYAYDIFDGADMSMLQVGDQITICQQNVKVTSLERNENGTVIINGGMDNDGYDLVSSDIGFYAMGFDDSKYYYELGEATIPVSADLVFVDSSDLEKGECTYYAGDLLTDDAGIEYNFGPDNTEITIQGGYVVSMQRVYTP